LTDTRLEVIERWLAAHLYCVTDRPYKSRSAGGASGTFDGNTDKGLDATLYGQTAKVLDTTGFLSSIGGGGGTGTRQGEDRHELDSSGRATVLRIEELTCPL
jgi:hypothetical protein